MIALHYDATAQRADLVSTHGRGLGGIGTDAGLETAVLVSLFTDRRADEADGLPAGANRRGWWGDAYLVAAGHQLGSRIWTLRIGGRVLQTTLDRLEELATEALQWLVDDGIAASVTAAATRLRPDTILLTVGIQRPDTTAPRWTRTWEVSLGLR